MLAVLFITLFVCLFLSVPIFASMLLAALLPIKMGYGMQMQNMMTQSLITSVNNYALMAIPFFMLLGSIMEKAGIAQGLIDLAERLVGKKVGGMGTAAIIACMFFAAISGSGPACVAAIGCIMIPAMTKHHYDNDYAGALMASGSTIGPVIPPSIPMIVYGATMGVSVTGLFTAGIIPGILMGVVLIMWNVHVAKRRGYIFEGELERKSLKNAIWAVIMPVIVLGGIYGGVFTPTESAVVGVVYAIFVGVFVYKRLTFKKFLEALLESAVLSATVMVVMGGASTFSKILTLEKVPVILTSFLNGISSNPLVIMLLINVILLIAGMFIDTTSNIILFAPLLCPIVADLGYDMIYFGVVMIVNLCIGMLTPPLGCNLFVAQAITGGSLEGIIKQVLPMITALILVLVLITVFPGIITVLPRLLGQM